MTHEARQTQKRLEGEILKLLEGEDACLYDDPSECGFCEKYKERIGFGCGKCPLVQDFSPSGNCFGGVFRTIDLLMHSAKPDAIPGALAIYMWLEEL